MPVGTNGNDTLTGTSGSDILEGLDGDDILDGLGGADTMRGGLGNDYYLVDNAGDTAIEAAGEGTDTVESTVSFTLGSHVENLTLSGANAINGTGNSLANILIGNGAANILDGSFGADTMQGGGGHDIYIVDNAGDVVTELAGGGTDTVQSSLSYVLGAELENLILTGTGNLNGTGNTLANSLTGNTGANQLDGGAGGDTMIGGLGNDSYFVDNGLDIVVEAAGGGTDIVNSVISHDLENEVENLILTGTANINGTGNDLANALTGNSGANRLDGGIGADMMSGGLGDDIYIVDQAGDVVSELTGQGSDTVQSAVGFTLTAALEHLVLTGTADNNGTGNINANNLTGNSGANILNGGAGADTMNGGLGNDTYVVDNVGDVVLETSAAGGTDSVQSSATFVLGSNIESLTLTGANAINGTGNNLANSLIGNSAANVLDGGVGADTMQGNGGNDTYVIDNAGDIVIEAAGGGTDTIQTSSNHSLAAELENLTLTGTGNVNGTGNSVVNVLIGNSGANQLDGGAGADTMQGGGGNDSYVVDNGLDMVVESAGGGTDTVNASITHQIAAEVENLVLTGIAAINGFGNGLANTLNGNDSANRLDGGLGADMLKGGLGDDIYVIDNVGDVVSELSGQGTDKVESAVSYTLAAAVENLTLTGSGDIDGTGNIFANVLLGNGGANRLDGGGSGDTMNGGLGDDTYVVDNAGDAVLETSASGGADTVESSVTFTLGSNIEDLILTGANAINGTGNSLANDLAGNAAANVLNGGTGADTMAGGAGADTYFVDNAGDTLVETSDAAIDQVNSSVTYTLAAFVENLTLTGVAAIDGTGNSLANVINGNSGANVLDGGGGGDTMSGGGGNDLYFVDDVGDQVIETSAAGGTDLVTSTVGFTLGANVENLVLGGIGNTDGIGNGLVNDIVGNSGANLLDGGGGGDRLEGGDGNDTYAVDNAGDQVVETSAAGGVDQVDSAVSFTLGTNVENLVLTGTAALNGTGNDGANFITGNSGANTLNGGNGIDSLTGGSGSDIYEFTTALGAGNIDVVEDFNSSADTIRLGGAAGQPFAALATGALAAEAFRAAGAAADSDDRILYNSATGALLYDADGVGGAAAVQFATVDPGLALTAADFVVGGLANHLPTIASGSTASVQENSPTSTIVYQTVASDSDSDTIAYSLGGADAAQFTIDQNGLVRFVTSPDFETDNSYSIIVLAEDSSGNGASRAVTVSVTDVNENVSAYHVNETAAANGTIGTAQSLDRNLFTAADNPNLFNDALPTAIIAGTVTSSTDTDYYSVTLQQGELLLLDVDNSGGNLDAKLWVYDSVGNLLKDNDDPGYFDAGSAPHPEYGHNTDSVIRFRAPADGTYYFAIESFQDPENPTFGSYELNASIGPSISPEEVIKENKNETNIAALMGGASWADPNLTYGFTRNEFDYGPGEATDELAAGMTQLNASQRAAVNTILVQYTNLTDLTFTQLSANPGDAQLRYALSNEPETAYAYGPAPGDGGDSWYNTTEYTSPVVGNYEWMTFVHETGHALGLKHGHEAPALTADRDSLEFSAMTYRGYIGASVDEGSGYTNETFGFPQTLMMYDIAALQRMYGADFTFNSGNTTYSWNSNTGAFSVNGIVQWTPGNNRVFMTLWDGGGEDTYDLSNYATNVTIDLRPGEWTRTSTIQLANLGDGNSARGNVANALMFEGDERSLIENAIGGASSDFILANQAANHLTGGGGGDTFRWASASDAGIGALVDTVLDFDSNESDLISLTTIDANPATAGDDAFTFLGTGAFTSTPGELRYEVVGGDAHILADLDGDGVADMQIILNDVTFIGGAEINF